MYETVWRLNRIRYFWGRVPNSLYHVKAFLEFDWPELISDWLMAVQIWNLSPNIPFCIHFDYYYCIPMHFSSTAFRTVEGCHILGRDFDYNC